MTPAATAPAHSITTEQSATFEEQGYLIIPRALPPDLLQELRRSANDIYAEEVAAERLGHGSALHLLDFVRRRRIFLELVDLRSTFPVVWGLLGWNIYVYHSHLDVHPSVPRSVEPRWGWHQDGGRQNLELETDPRPMLSVKVAFVLSDLSRPGRGNTLILPGSHRRNTLPRPTDPGPGDLRPPGTIELLAEPGDAVVLDRRLWHSRSPNHSPITRQLLFLAYTYRWIRQRDTACADVIPNGWDPSPIRRQLLGAGDDPRSFWGLGDAEVPLKQELRSHGQLNPEVPSHRG